MRTVAHIEAHFGSSRLEKINAPVLGKNVSKRRHRVLFRCDGEVQLGLGHTYRCLALAEELREMHGWEARFAMVTGPAGFALVDQAGYAIERNAGGCEEVWLETVIERFCPDVLVLDVRCDLARTSVEKWRNKGLLIASIDDRSERRLEADLAFYPPVPQVLRMDWTGYKGRVFSGWEWVVLRREFARRLPRQTKDRVRMLVTMGGSDPAGLTLRAIECLDLLEEDFETWVVLGPAFVHREALMALLTKSHRRFDLVQNATEISGLMSQADLAVASFGITAYELAAMGVPAIYLCLTAEHAESASVFVTNGMAISLGIHNAVSVPALAGAIRHLLTNESDRLRMAAQAQRQLDARGVERIARVITEKVTSAEGP